MNPRNPRSLSSELSHRVEEVDEVAGDECEGARVDGVEVVAQGAVVAEGVAEKYEASLMFSSLHGFHLLHLARGLRDIMPC